jgi:hypothetical protein
MGTGGSGLVSWLLWSASLVGLGLGCGVGPWGSGGAWVWVCVGVDGVSLLMLALGGLGSSVASV